ncbi:unnamed protein product [Protopolystoma xenopodis]|uniref:Uncharacterized protein n=1 Tax=Protopolystoma xenopodis TaxID=117903 RepID=A0A448X8T4_9PLAT|nr:unnamed protein product [Protopolystoma xenopodis]
MCLRCTPSRTARQQSHSSDRYHLPIGPHADKFTLPALVSDSSPAEKVAGPVGKPPQSRPKQMRYPFVHLPEAVWLRRQFFCKNA